LSIVVLCAAALTVNQAPVLGLGTVPTCAVWVVYANSRMQIDHVLPEADSRIALSGHRA